MPTKQIRIAIIGLGTVGKATMHLITQHRKDISCRSGIDIVIRKICVRREAKSLPPELRELLCYSYEEALDDPEIDCVVELVGGVDTAFHIISQALQKGKNVVTANKALLAVRGAELFSLARKHNTCIGFEASCGGGIPIIRSLTDGLLANNIQGIFAVLNGTCNYILTQMSNNNAPYEEALQKAQEDGVAEADPELDVSGADAAHKIAIMSALAFGLKVNFEDISIRGLEGIHATDILYGKELGYNLKLVSAAYQVEQGIAIWVRPAFMSQEHSLAWVSDTFNAVSIYGDAAGHTLYYGRGAGGTPTASAVVSDIIGMATGSLHTFFRHTGHWQDINTRKDQVHVHHTAHRFYLRLNVDDRPGVLAKLANILSSHHISIASVLQNEIPEHTDPQTARVVITTHSTKEASMEKAIQEIDRATFARSHTVSLAILDEFPEFSADNALHKPWDKVSYERMQEQK